MRVIESSELIINEDGSIFHLHLLPEQLSDIVIGLERNSQDADKVKANTTILRVLKNRDFGVKGPASAVVYDTDTTRLTEISLEEFDDETI